MAAGAYKGLTIRIGADTTKLSSALRGINSVAYKTESELRKLNKAAKLEPGNTKIAAAQLGAMASQATVAAEKLGRLQRSVADTKAQFVELDDDSMRQLVSDIDDATEAAQKAQSEFGETNTTVSGMWESLKKLTGIDLRAAANNGPQEYVAALSEMYQWTQENEDKTAEWEQKTGASITGVIGELSKLEDGWFKTNDAVKKLDGLQAIKDSADTFNALAKGTENAALEAEKAEERYNALNANIESAYAEVKKLTGIDLREETNNGHFHEAFESVKQSGKVSEETIAKIESMKDAWLDAFRDMQNAQLAESVHNANTEITLVEAELQQVARAMAQLNVRSDFSQQFGDMTVSMQTLNAAADSVNERLSRINAASEVDSSNIDVARERASALGDALQIAEAQGRILNTELSQYKAEGYEEAAAQIGNVQLALERTKKTYEDSEAALAPYTARLKDAKDELKRLEDVDDKSDASVKAIEDQKKVVSEAQQEFDKFKTSRDEALAKYDTAKACSEMERLKSLVIENDAYISKLRDSFGNIRFESGVSLQVGQLSQELGVISAGAATAKSRFEALNNAANIRPHSLGTAIDRMRALREATDAARQKADNLKQQLERYKSEGIDKIADKTDDAAVAFEKANDKVNDLNKQLANAEKQFGKDSDEAKKLGEELKKAVLDANTAAAVNEYKELETQLRVVQSEAKEMRTTLRESITSGFGQMGSAAVIAAQQVGQLASRAGREVVDASNEVDAAYRNLTKTLDAGEDDYKKLYDAAMEYGSANVTSASTMLEMESIAAQLGVGLNEDGDAYEKTADSIQRFAEVAANLDVATNIDADTIALQMGQIMNVMNDLDEDNIESFGDALVRLGNKMPTQESNIMQITQRLSAIGDVAGFTTPQLMGWAAAIASTGQKSEAAATGVSTIITKISTAVSAGGKDVEAITADVNAAVDTGGKALKNYASIAGVAAKDFADAWKSDPEAIIEKVSKSNEAGIMKYAEVAGMSAKKFVEMWQKAPSDALQAVIEGLSKSGDDLFATLTGMDVSSVRQTQTLASLAQTTDNLTKSINYAEEAWEGGGDAATEAEKKAMGFSGTLAKIKNSVQVLAASFGDALLPWMQKGLDLIQSFTDRFNALDPKVKENAVLIGGLSVAFTTALPIVKTFGGALFDFASGALTAVINGVAYFASGGFATKIMQVWGVLTKGMIGLKAAFATFMTTGGTLVPILGAVAVAVAAIAAATADWKKTSDQALAFDSTMKGISGTVEGLHRDLRFGASSVNEYAEAWQAAGYDVDEFFQKQQDHIAAMNDSRLDASQTIGNLSMYEDVINDALGAGEDWNGNLSELEWALKGLADATGTTYTAEEILAGSYKDEEGNVIDLTKAIGNLIEQKKKESQLNALTDMRTEAVKGQLEAKDAINDAAEAYKNYFDVIKKSHGFTDEETSAYITENAGKTGIGAKSDVQTLEKLGAEWDKAKAVYDEWGEKIETIDREYHNFVENRDYHDADVFGEREGIMQTTATMKEAVESLNGIDASNVDIAIKAIAQSLQDAGVSVDDFKNISETTFSELAEQSGGDIETFINLLASVTEREPLEFNFDANYEKAEESFNTFKEEKEGTPIKQDVEVNEQSAAESEQKADEVAKDREAEIDVKVNEESAAAAEEKINEVANSGTSAETTQNVTTNISATADTSGIDAFNKALSGVAKSTTAKLKIEVDGLSNVSKAADALKKNAKTWKATFAINVTGKGALDTVLRTLRNEDGKKRSTTLDIYRITHTKTVGDNASGGYVPRNASGGYLPHDIPRHADGFIATKATLTNYGWIGEDGAEMYSGGNLVPLTNRKYSMPYIDDISDAVARKLGPVNNGSNITVTVTGVSSPNEVANAIAQKLSILDF